MGRYDEIAEWYDAWLEEGTTFSDLVIPAVLKLIGNPRGQLVCDLACGQGILARSLAERGARVVGLDLSMRMIELGVPRDPRVRYVRGDACRIPFREAFDGVVCNMSLMDIDELDPTAGGVARVLRPKGWFVCSVTHPAFQTPHSVWSEIGARPARLVSGYFEEGFWRSPPDAAGMGPVAARIRSRVGAVHRTLGTYFNTLIRSGLSLVKVEEPRASGAAAQRVPGYAEVPPVLLMRWERR
jgi:SAM-dependent methyltransferase